MVRSLPILLLTSTALAQAGLPSPCGDFDRCRFEVRIHGSFARSERSPFSDENLAALSSGFSSTVNEALDALGMKRLEGSPDAVVLEGRGGDERFAIEIEARTDEVRVTARSFHRPPQVYGQASAHLKSVRKKEWQMTALRAAVRDATLGAMADLAARIDEHLRPERTMKLSVRVNGLDQEQRQFVERRLLPCVTRLYRTVPGTEPSLFESVGYVELAFRYVPQPDEPREPLRFHAERVRASVASHGAVECSTFGTPLERHKVNVAEDELNQAVIVSFVAPR